MGRPHVLLVRQAADHRAGEPARPQGRARRWRATRSSGRSSTPWRAIGASSSASTIGEGVVLDGWCLKPPGFDPAKKYPVLVHVYGEPAAQNVVDRWGGEHLPLAPHARPARLRRAERRQPGHARAPRARRGGSASTARSASWPRATRPRRSRPSKSAGRSSTATRVGIWGWSGGGSMTLDCIFRYPELYQTGIAIAFVADQRYYDTIYQERYMGLPSDNPEGYKQGSPDHPRRRPEGQPAADPRHGRRQRPLPELRGAGQPPDRPQQAVLDDGLSQPHPQHQRGRRHPPPPVRADDAVPRAEPAAGAAGMNHDAGTWASRSPVWMGDRLNRGRFQP